MTNQPGPVCIGCNDTIIFDQMQTTEVREDGWLQYTFNCCGMLQQGAMNPKRTVDWVDSRYPRFYSVANQMRDGKLERTQ